MTAADLHKSAQEDTEPSPTLSEPLMALWWDAKGNWEQAHEVCQSAGSKDGDWVHAYLHRKEGDQGNAAYWYSRASRPVYRGELDDEWTAMVDTLLEQGA